MKMRFDPYLLETGQGLYVKIVLTVIAVLLGVEALRPLMVPVSVQAQSDASFLYIEPGVTGLRRPDGSAQLNGKVVIDLRNGGIWGFPTLSSLPYPVDSTNTVPPLSKPMYLGHFDFSAMK